MFSILDILKKHREEKSKAVPAAQAQDPPKTPLPKEGEASCSPSVFFNEEVHASVSVFSALNREITDENMRQMSRVYDDAVAVARKVYAPKGTDIAVIKNELDPLLARIVAMLSGGNREAVKICLSDYAVIQEYPYYHAVNVCLLSIELGLGLKYEPDVLLELAKAAFLHDIGLSSMTDVIMKTTTLNSDELARVKTHSVAGVEILNTISREFSHFITDAVAQVHERLDGSGYPRGLKADAISAFARVVGVADTYEAMTHSRPYRPPYTPGETVNAILGVKGTFDSRIIKSLIERVGIFPEGSKVRLNTKETAVVIRMNSSSPLRPVVSVVRDAQGNELKLPKEIDLCKNYLIHIEENLGR
jgi:HD-GYP domain-containing protein (c-di-GMP phosphodiesterase class II)